MNGWMPLVLTKERADLLWQQLAAFPEVRAQMEMDTPIQFWAALSSKHNLFYDVGPGFGLVAALNVRPGLDAVVYFLAFDRHTQEKAPVFIEIVHELFRLGELRRLTTYTPANAMGVLRLLPKLGFRWEGVLREAWSWNEHVKDLYVNGCLRADCGVEQPSPWEAVA